MTIIILLIILLLLLISFVIYSNSSLNNKASNKIESETNESYISCGCGCCGFDKPLEEIAKEECLYKSKGEDIQDKKDQDKQLDPQFCATVGCSFPTKYVYCD